MSDSTHLAERPLSLSQNAHQQLIGYLGLLLPVLLVALSASRPVPTLRRWPPLDSVSAYYYSGAVAVFVGVLFGLAFFLLTYPGYSRSWEDRALGRLGGVCALGVAFFPTQVPVCVVGLPWWKDIYRPLHYTFAALLFVVFILFSLWLFRRSDVPKGTPLPPGKKKRNAVYVVCGLVMIVCVLWTGLSGLTGHPIFVPETITLWAFSVSWLVKGRARRTFVSAVRQLRGRGV